MRNKLIAGGIALLAIFLLGFLPQYLRANRLDSELQQLRRQSAGAELRDLIGLCYVQANQKNYGLAAESCSRFFNRVRETANQTQDPEHRKTLESLAALRDKVTAEMAKGDPAVISDLQDLFVKTRQATTAGPA